MDVRDKIYINGSWVASTGKGTLEVIDSTTEEVMATIPEGTPEDVDKAVRAAAAAFRGRRFPASPPGELGLHGNSPRIRYSDLAFHARPARGLSQQL